MRRGVVGLDGAVSEYCDLSGRGLTTIQVERTLRVFETAVAIDVSNNEIDKLPSSIPKELVALDISFNLISSIQGIERLQHLQELHLGFNRLTDVSVLEFCPQLVRVNLSGNRLMNTKGIETLPFLENLDLSENLIELYVFRLLLNQSLTHLSLRGNPISVKADYRVLLLDMIPSVLMLDNKKIRTTVKYKTHDGGPAAKSLSYSRLYDDKKQFIMRNQNRQTTTATMALQLTTVADNDANVSNNGSTIPSGGMYMSIYDRLAQANGLTTKPPEPVSDVPKQQEDRTSKARSTSMKQLKSTISPRQKTRGL
ncbi:TPA: hypothetical protein N0F65_004205 [Lagenidium giganteum]|uniref:Dynein axonemal light chain 1 n=1 Tax=Lagenidium giganteum TaxID=4803 RepID=A0AAV2YJV3_9STRA|nr:TPA: hypothetical protein N0F65_004205 [Lagenidium giganteum]